MHVNSPRGLCRNHSQSRATYIETSSKTPNLTNLITRVLKISTYAGAAAHGFHIFSHIEASPASMQVSPQKPTRKYLSPNLPCHVFTPEITCSNVMISPAHSQTKNKTPLLNYLVHDFAPFSRFSRRALLRRYTYLTPGFVADGGADENESTNIDTRCLHTGRGQVGEFTLRLLVERRPPAKEYLERTGKPPKLACSASLPHPRQTARLRNEFII